MKSFLFLTLLFWGIMSYGQTDKLDETVVAIDYTWFADLREFGLTIDSSAINYEVTSKYRNLTVSTYHGMVEPSQWENIISQVSRIDLKKLNQILSPTVARAGDGAPYAKLIIHTNKNTYETQYFDAGVPMTEIWDVLFLINEMLDVEILRCDEWRHNLKKP